MCSDAAKWRLSMILAAQMRRHKSKNATQGRQKQKRGARPRFGQIE
jgi:hypothetical protein